MLRLTNFKKLLKFLEYVQKLVKIIYFVVIYYKKINGRRILASSYIKYKIPYSQKLTQCTKGVVFSESNHHNITFLITDQT